MPFTLPSSPIAAGFLQSILGAVTAVITGFSNAVTILFGSFLGVGTQGAILGYIIVSVLIGFWFRRGFGIRTQGFLFPAVVVFIVLILGGYLGGGLNILNNIGGIK